MKKIIILLSVFFSFQFSSCFVFPIKDYKTIDATIDVANQKDTISVGDTIWFKSQFEPTANINNKNIDLSELPIPFAIMIKQFSGNDALSNFDSIMPTTTSFDIVPIYLNGDEFSYIFYGTNSIYTAGVGGMYKMKDSKLTAEIAFVAKDTGNYLFSALSYDVLYKQVVNKRSFLAYNYSFNIENTHKLNSKVINKQELINKYYTVVVKN